jgi:hypothetical protein
MFFQTELYGIVCQGIIGIQESADLTRSQFHIFFCKTNALVLLVFIQPDPGIFLCQGFNILKESSVEQSSTIMTSKSSKD